MACWQIKRAAPFHFGSICTWFPLEIIFLYNIISKYGDLHVMICNRKYSIQNILHQEPLISSSCLISVNKIVCKCTEISFTCSQPLYTHRCRYTAYTQILCVSKVMSTHNTGNIHCYMHWKGYLSCDGNTIRRRHKLSVGVWVLLTPWAPRAVGVTISHTSTPAATAVWVGVKGQLRLAVCLRPRVPVWVQESWTRCWIHTKNTPPMKKKSSGPVVGNLSSSWLHRDGRGEEQPEQKMNPLLDSVWKQISA